MHHLVSYAHQTLTDAQIRDYARQYQDIDMWRLTGQDADYFPFLIGPDDNLRIVYWSKRHGIIDYHDDDRVRYHAFGRWLADNMHPQFACEADAWRFAIEREWPRADT